MEREAVSVRAAYERFPVSVKGAFLLRGADGLPHQVRIESARATECSGRGGRVIGLEAMVLEVAPTLDIAFMAAHQLWATPKPGARALLRAWIP